MILQKEELSLSRIGSIVVLALVVAGCAATPRGPVSVPPGSQLEIRQTLEVPYGSARVFIQGGRVVAQGNLDPWSVYCSVQTRPIREAGEAQTRVEPGRFEVYEVRQFNDINRTGRVYTAALASLEEWPAYVVFQVEMRVRSAEQPAVRALICAKGGSLSYGFNVGAYYPKLSEIRAAIGDLVKIVTP